MTIYDHNSTEDFDARWGDIRSDLRRSRVDVEWGGTGRQTRRARAFGPAHGRENKRSFMATAAMIASLAVAVVFATFMSINLMNGPASNEGDASKVEGLVPVTAPSDSPSQIIITSLPSESPSSQPSGLPTVTHSQNPTTEVSDSPSQNPSINPSELPSVIPSAIQKAPPAANTTLECIDQEGLFHNHKKVGVSCEWFRHTGIYALIKNCGKTDLGKACSLTCSDYNDCAMPPTPRPSSSVPSSSPSVSPTVPLPKSLTIVASEDTSIKKETPNANLGSASWLKVDADTGTFHALIRFDLKGHDFSRPVESASLRLKAASNCSFGGHIERTEHSNWNENTVTWADAPAGEGDEIARFTSITAGYWYSVDVTSALHPDKAHLSLRLFPLSTEECLFVSKDNASGEGPELRIIYE